MKKNSLIFSALVLALSLMACAFSNSEEKELAEIEALQSQDLASNTEAPSNNKRPY